ncbi:WD repeat-containing protein 90 [Carcharodon carcharias]|uniref:WD repeat-containing protein 90 n=1 Tax=Carcharodon carcharias TaxID=13397 RepID=UPI001B7F31C8|nr:WD repeat-containing protein 90 [Carcharodon carcharias]XP_041063041.1 WD repeat-containing protein 90 [Carcharodon carcharias]
MDKPRIESVWQRPYVNIFKHFKLEEWKKSAKEGDVTAVMDKTLKCTVYRIRGPIPPGNYIQLPKTSTQSLGLVGRYVYLLFKPIVSKYFVVHFDTVTEGSQVIRISFSNLFKEFKSTATWLQFPFVCGAVEGSVYNTTAKTAKQDLVGLAPPGVKWTCLMMDLQYLLSFYLNRHYSHLKSIKLCSNMFVKNIFTSDLVFEPSVTAFKVKRAGLVLHDVSPMPREMAFLVPKGENWHDIYDYIRFPSDGVKMPFDSIQKGQSSPHKKGHPTHCTPIRANPHTVSVSKAVQDRVSLIQQITSPETAPCRRRSSRIITSIPEIHLDTTVSPHHDKDNREHGDQTTAKSDECMKVAPVDDGGIHVFAGQSGRVAVQKCSSDTEEPVRTKVPSPTRLLCQKFKDPKGLQPDPILKLKKIIGYGGCTVKCAAWTKSGSAVAYPCHAIVVVMEIDTGQQRFFIGHTDKVSALSFNGNSTLLASAQTGNVSLVRVWNFNKGNCLAMFKTHIHSVSSLSFSFSGRVLCGVGKDSRGKTMVVVWNTAKVNQDGEVMVLAKAHTEVDIQVMKIASFDDTRMVSCGRDNIRLWRVRSRALRSCPVNLGEYHCLEFTDVAFEEGHLADKDPADRMLFACSKSGHIIEIDYKNVVIKNARRLFPSQQKHSHQREMVNSGAGIAINSISVSAAFCATGSDDGYLRLWPLDFSTVFLEAEHESGVSFVNIDPNGLKVLAATTTGNLGYLDIPSRGYTTLMRSHTNRILAFSVDGIRRHLVTASEDCTIRLWDLDSMQQLYDFVSAEETPCAVTFHPTQQIFACGFSSGVVRIFNVGNSSLLTEQRQHRGQVIGLVFSPKGEYMYSAGSLGSLALYNATEEDHHVIRILGNVVARGSHHGPDALTVSSDSRYLAFVGPSEYIVTVMDARSLDEIMLVDVSILDLETTTLDTAVKVCYPSAAISQLLVTTSSNKILWLNARTGKLIREVCNIHKTVSSSLAVSEDIRYLLTTGEKVIKIWDYHMKQDINFQVFIGHSETIQQAAFTPDQLSVISVGDAIFVWDFLASVLDQETNLPSIQPFALHEPDAPSIAEGSELFQNNGMPRQSVPVPISSPPQLSVNAIERTEQDVFLSDAENKDDHSQKDDSIAVKELGDSFLQVHENLHCGEDVSPFLRPVSLQECQEELEEPVSLVGDGDFPHNYTRPDSYKHFAAQFKTSSVSQVAVLPDGKEDLKLKVVIGYNGNGRGNMVWNPDTALFAYSCGCLVVIEDLHSGSQRHLTGHTEEISTIAVSHDAQDLASASGSQDKTGCSIFIWNMTSGCCKKVVSQHMTEVQAMAYSRDDRFLMSAGDYRDLSIALWETRNYELLTTARVSNPIHDLAFDPTAVNEFACVGVGGVHFWLVEQTGNEVQLKVHRVSIPDEVGADELSALCYNSDSVLYTATNTGKICAWDTQQNRCFMAWDADEGEIGIVQCRRYRLMTGSNTKKIRLWAVAAVQEMRLEGTRARSSSVLLEHEMILDGTIVSAVFDDIMDMGIVGTTAGTLWYINWAENTSIRLISGHRNKVNQVIFSPDESHFATCAEDGSLRVWVMHTTELVVQFHVLNQSCLCMAWSPAVNSRESVDKQQIVAGYSDGTIRLFGMLKTEMKLKIHPHPVAVNAIAYSMDGEVVISGGKDGLMAVSSPRTGITIRVISDHKGSPITTIECARKKYDEFGLDGCEMWLAVSSDRRVSVWATDWHKDLCELIDWLTFPAPIEPEGSDKSSLPPSLAAFSPSQSGVVVYVGFGVKPEIILYNLYKKQTIKNIALPQWATSLSLSPRGQLIAVGTNGRLLKLIQNSSGKFQDFTGHNDTVHFSRFTPSGKFLLSVAYNEVLVWEVQNLRSNFTHVQYL